MLKLGEKEAIKMMLVYQTSDCGAYMLFITTVRRTARYQSQRNTAQCASPFPMASSVMPAMLGESRSFSASRFSGGTKK